MRRSKSRRKTGGRGQVRTIFTRMLVMYLAVIIGALLMTGIVTGVLFRSYTMRERRDTMAREISAVMQLYENMLSGITPPEVSASELTLIARHYDGLIQIVHADGQTEQYASETKWNAVSAETYTEAEARQLIADAVKAQKRQSLFEKRREPFDMLVLTKAAEGDGAPDYCIRFYSDTQAMQGALLIANLELVMVILLAILVSVIVVYKTTTQLTKPFLEINDTVQKYSKGDYNLRIPISNIEEASQLAVSFNAMADQLKDLEETRRSFVANVSHELRSPLTSMKGFLEAMQDGTIDERDYEKYIDIVLSETRRMTAMVNDLLDLARIESGKTALKIETFDINELIRRTLLTFEARIYEKTMEVDVKFAQEQFFVEADNTQIGQVLRNIIDNAIKYSPDHSRLRIATYAVKRDVFVSISDSGQGIPEEDVPHVFDRFYKVEKAHTPTQQSGTGLGLSIVKRIIDQHGQTITLKSARGKGSTFTFTLKRTPSPKRTQQDGGKRNGSVQ